MTAGADTIFDTDENMPHIVGSAYIADVAVNYPNPTGEQAFLGYIVVPNVVFVDPPPYYEYACTYGEISPGSFYSVYVYDPGYYDFFTGVFSPGYSYIYFVYEPPVYGVICGTTLVDPPGFYETQYVDVPTYGFVISANEYDSTVAIADSPVDEDGSSISIDFLIVQATGSRSVAGSDPITNTSIYTSLPSGTMSFQGSILLETGGNVDGTSWLRRIISVGINNATGKLTIRNQSSNASVTANPGSFETTGSYSIASNFLMSFKVFFGRFKS